MVLKHSLHQLVDELPEEELSTALRFLQYLKEVGGETYETYLDGTDDDGFADTVLSDPEDLPALVTEEEEQAVGRRRLAEVPHLQVRPFELTPGLAPTGRHPSCSYILQEESFS